MFFNVDKKPNLIILDPNTFLTLKKLDESNSNQKKYTFQLRLSAPIKTLFDSKLFTINVKIYSRIIPKVITDTTTNKILSLKMLQEMQKEHLVTEQNIDITSYISNDDIKLLQNNVDISYIQSFQKKKIVYKNVSDLNSQNKNIVILNQISWQNIDDFKSYINDSNPIDVKRMSYELINSGIDPSYVSSLQHRSTTSRQVIGGLIRKQRSQETQDQIIQKKCEKLLNVYLFKNNKNVIKQTNELQTNTKVPVYETQASDVQELTTEFTILSDHINKQDTRNLFIVCSISDKNGLFVTNKTQQFDLNEHIKNYKIPLTAPNIKLVKSFDQTNNTLEISKFDDKTKFVLLYKKQIMQNNFAQTYSYIRKIPVTTQQPIRIKVDALINATSIYRIIPTSGDAIGNDFTNIVVKSNNRYTQQNAISLIAQIVASGIKLEARNLPNNVVAVQFLVKNKSWFETTYKSVSEVLTLTDEIRKNNFISTIDTSVKENCIYEYAIKCFYNFGSNVVYTSSMLIEFIKQKIAVSTVMSNILIDSNSDIPNVSFQFDTQLLNDNFNILHDLLKLDAIDSYYANDIKSDRDLFKKLLAHNIQRLNLTTGEREDFGVITQNIFDDRANQINNAVKPLNIDHKYRYEIYPLLRSPDTLFNSFTKEVIDQATKKKYYFQPSKFLHPVALNNGLLLTQKGKDLLFAKNDLLHGIVGNVLSYDVSFNITTTFIQTCFAQRINYDTIKLQWNINGNKNHIDHFIIMKDVLGVRTVVGKMHTNVSQTVNFIHKLTKDDIGQFKYVIVPVYVDYSLGMYLESNDVEVLNVIN